MQPWITDDQKVNRLVTLNTITSVCLSVIHRLQGGIKCGTCSYPELTEDHVLTSAYVKIFRTVTRNAVNEGV